MACEQNANLLPFTCCAFMPVKLTIRSQFLSIMPGRHARARWKAAWKLTPIMQRHPSSVIVRKLPSGRVAALFIRPSTLPNQSIADAAITRSPSRSPISHISIIASASRSRTLAATSSQTSRSRDPLRMILNPDYARCSAIPLPMFCPIP